VIMKITIIDTWLAGFAHGRWKGRAVHVAHVSANSKVTKDAERTVLNVLHM